MRDDLKDELHEAGEELRASHDDAVIADVIGEIEALDDENSENTAKLLREMVQFEE